MASLDEENDSSSSYESINPEEMALDSKEDDSEVKHLKEELSQIPFCELQDLRDKVGSKKYNQAIHGVLEQRKTKTEKTEENKKKAKQKPMEVSSKKKVAKMRQVVPVKKKAGRDPRFDDLSGNFNEELFSKTYSFVDEIKSKEKKDIEKQFKKTKNVKRKETLQNLLKRINHDDHLKKAKEKKMEENKIRKKTEKELIKQGKRPYYLKKSEQKRLELAEKYKKLKSSGKLQTYLTKRRKKTASKDRKHIPQRREATTS